MPPDLSCPVCNRKDPDVECEVCRVWYHQKCVLPHSLKPPQIEKIHWHCDECSKAGLVRMKQYNEAVKKLNEDISECRKREKELDAEMTRCAEIRAELEQKICAASTAITSLSTDLPRIESRLKYFEDIIIDTKKEIVEKVEEVGIQTSQSYADTLKKRVRPMEKNLVIVESTDDTSINVKKNAVASALRGIQVNDTRFSDKKIIMNFASEREMNDAMSKLNDIHDVRTKNVRRKLSPKIMICNVYKDEVKDDLIRNLIDRNEYLQAIEDVEHKISLLFEKPAAGNTLHYVLKCDPSVRKLIHDNHDRIKLVWSVYEVRDRYWVTTCHYCQRHGHIEKNCSAKTKNEGPFCKYCSGRHKTDQCNESTRKCINCVRYKNTDTDHAVGDRCCQVLIKETMNIKEITDHGY